MKKKPFHLRKLKLIISIPVIFFYTSICSAQVFLNNFGITEVVKTHSRYTRFTQLDFNNDNITDIILYGNRQKSFVIHKGLKDSSFSKPTSKFFFFPIDDFKWISKSKSGENYYLFTSRNKRLVGLVSFTQTFSLQLLNTIEFASYPSNIKIVDLNNDGVNEALIFGNNFDGIVKIQSEGYFLNSEKLIEQSLFSDLEVLDINNDGLEDIIASDILNNSLNFFENTEEGTFVLNREFEKTSDIKSLKKFDFNEDQFTDLIVGTEEGIEVFEGDSVFSFSNSWHMDRKRSVENFFFADINDDRKFDIIIPNYTDNLIEFLFSGKANDLGFHFSVNSLTDFQKKKSKTDNSFIALGGNGFINIYSSKDKRGRNFSFSVNGYPEKLFFSNNKLKKILYTDSIENSVNFIEISSNQKFTQTGQYQLLNNFSDIYYSSSQDFAIGFEKKTRLLEFAEFSGDSRSQNYFYTKNPVLQINSGESNIINIIELDKDGLYLEKIKKSDKKIESAGSIQICKYYDSAFLQNNGDVLYWQKVSGDLVLNKFSENQSKKIFSINNADSSIISTIFSYSENVKKNSAISIIFSKEKDDFYLIENSFITKYKFLGKKRYPWLNGKSKYFSLNGKDVLANYNKDELKLSIFEFNTVGKNIKLNSNVERININDYFVTDIFGITYLVYTNYDNNLITFKTLTL